MKRITILITFVLILNIFIPSISVAAVDEQVTVENLRYQITSEEEKTVRVVKGENYNDLVNVVVPNSISINGQTYTVTSIYGFAFKECEKLETVVVSDGITEVDNGAFSGCNNLKSVTLPEGITEIADFLFYKCYNLTNFNIPSTATRIGWNAFQECNSIKSITIPGTVRVIDEFAFYNNSGLTKVILEDGVYMINRYAFSYCTNLTDITIPNTVKGMGNFIFNGCDNVVIHARENSIAASYATRNSIDIEYIVIPLVSVSINGKETMEIGTTQKLSVSYNPSDNTNTASPKWVSSNTSVATVNNVTGRVSALTAGTTTITLTVGDLTDTMEIKVLGPSFKKGDINNDGKVNIFDINYGLQKLSKKNLTEKEIERGDVTDDGKYSVLDINKVLRYLSGKIKEL